MTEKQQQRAHRASADIHFRMSSNGSKAPGTLKNTQMCSLQGTLHSKNGLLTFTFRVFVCEIQANLFNLSSQNKPVILSQEQRIANC